MKMSKMIVLKLDGEVWECEPGWDTDENSICNVRAIHPQSPTPSDQAAMMKGITHRQHAFSGDTPCHEIRKLGETGDGKKYQ